MRVTVVVVLDAHEVLREGQLSQARIGVVALRHSELRRFGALWSARCLQRQGEAHDAAAAHEPRGNHGALRVQPVDRTALILRAPAPPRSHRLEQSRELRRRDLRSRAAAHEGVLAVAPCRDTARATASPGGCRGRTATAARVPQLRRGSGYCGAGRSLRWTVRALAPPRSIMAMFTPRTPS